MNKLVTESPLLRETFQVETVNLQFARNMTEIERFSLRKVGLVFYFAGLILYKLLSFRPDLVYFTFSPRGFAFYRDMLYSGLMKLFGKKRVYHLHGKGLGRSANQNYLTRKACEWVFKGAEVICLSPRLQRDITEVFPKDVYFVPNGIVAGPVPESRDAAKAVPNILYLSNYIEAKGVLVLINALKLVKERGLPFTARMVGAPGDLSVDDLKNLIRELELTDEVTVVGPRYKADKISEFQEADFFVFPTYYPNEAFPLVNLEAMQFGLPIISTDEGGIPDMLLEGESGFIVESRNVQQLADRIVHLLEHPEHRAIMGEKGYQHFQKNYTLEKFYLNLNNTFSQILGLPTKLLPLDLVSQSIGNKLPVDH